MIGKKNLLRAIQSYKKQHSSTACPIIIVGAGISGLTLGYALKSLQIPYKILDTAPRTGGKIQTMNHPFGLVESAANALLMDKSLDLFFKDLNLSILAPKTNHPKRWIIEKNGQWTSQLVLQLKILKQLIFNGYHFIPTNDQQSISDLSISTFLQPLLGTELTAIVSSLFKGIYANDGSQLSCGIFFSKDFLDHIEKKTHHHKNKITYLELLRWWLANRPYQFITKSFKSKNKTRSGSISFKNGMQDLIDALTNFQKDQIQLSLNSEKIFEEIAPLGRHVIFCCPIDMAKHYLQKISEYEHKKTLQQVIQEFSTLNYNSIATTTFFSTIKIERLKHSFGAIWQTGPYMGILANSEIFDHRTVISDLKQYYSYTLISDILDLETVEKFFTKEFLQGDFSLLASKPIQTVWPNAIVNYSPHHQQVLERLEQFISNSRFTFLGHYTGSIGIRNIIKESLSFLNDENSSQ